jgi:abortive infection bacteriophage resistance protein
MEEKINIEKRKELKKMFILILGIFSFGTLTKMFLNIKDNNNNNMTIQYDKKGYINKIIKKNGTELKFEKGRLL